MAMVLYSSDKESLFAALKFFEEGAKNGNNYTCQGHIKCGNCLVSYVLKSLGSSCVETLENNSSRAEYIKLYLKNNNIEMPVEQMEFEF